MPSTPSSVKASFTGGSRAELEFLTHAKGVLKGPATWVLHPAILEYLGRADPSFHKGADEAPASLAGRTLSRMLLVLSIIDEEMARIEAGIPRFGVDMGESNLAPEAGIESRAISYTKGCYIGQEVIARIRTYGNVAKALRRLRLADDLKDLPKKGDKLFRDGKEAGYITSAVASPALKANVALGYVRKEANQAGTELILRTADGESVVKVEEAP